MVQSAPAEARSFPSGLKVTQNTLSPCPRRTAVFLPLPTSHSRMVWSSLAEASSLPSGLKARQ
jgi:hypothetical protein